MPESKLTPYYIIPHRNTLNVVKRAYDDLYIGWVTRMWRNFSINRPGSVQLIIAISDTPEKVVSIAKQKTLIEKVEYGF